MKPTTIAKLLLAGALGACGPTSAGAPATTAPTTAAPAAVATTASGPTRPAWRNPGGMWLPRQLAAQADTLKSLGFRLDPASLADPTMAPLGAVVSLGGCSASFVSASGLVVTNHHCVQGALAYNSTPEQNIIENGFHARSKAEEKWAGPTAHVYVATKFTDVTATMLAGLDQLPSDQARYDALEARGKQLVADCEKGRPELRCKVVDYFEGAEWQLVEQLDIRDVRLVYAPPRGVGNYGGEVDNWMWPRHTGDFSFYRAYVGKDGKPADHSPDNVPFAPTHVLKVASEPLREGDFVMVAGYPGRTSRLVTAWQVEDAATWEFPRGLAMMKAYVDTIDGVVAGKPELAIKAEPRKRGLLNYLKKNAGVLDTMLKGGLVEQRKQQDAALFAWIDAEPARKAKYRPGLDRMAKLIEERRATREADAAFAELLRGSSLLGQALTIVRSAEERGKPDADRKPGFQERDAQRTQQASMAMEKSYARELDRAVFEMFIERALALPPERQPALLGDILGKKRDAKAVDAALDRLYKGTKLEDVKVRLELLKTATPAALKKSKDPFIQLALAALPTIMANEARDEAYEGAMTMLAPLYVAAMKEMKGGLLAPDANSTLRITYGTVLPSPRGGKPFTVLSEVVAKATGEAPFDAPPALLEAVKAKQFGPYVDAALGEVPVDFLSDVDTTGGNSGSATLNARGELVGLLFDGTLDTVASDWLYLVDVTRSIHVDTRYMLWFLDAVAGADELVEELGVKPVL